jgi:hypothetical protein
VPVITGLLFLQLRAVTRTATMAARVVSTGADITVHVEVATPEPNANKQRVSVTFCHQHF